MKSRFGIHAVSMGFVTKAQLNEAIKMQKLGRNAIGVVMVGLGLISPSKAGEVLARQNAQLKKKTWGECALDLGLITKNDLNEALRYQAASKMPLDRVLFELGYLNDWQREKVNNKLKIERRRKEIQAELQTMKWSLFRSRKKRRLLNELIGLH